MDTLIAYPKNEAQETALKAIFKALDVPFDKAESPYNPEFVKKIMDGEEDFKAGKGRKISVEELNNLWK